MFHAQRSLWLLVGIFAAGRAFAAPPTLLSGDYQTQSNVCDFHVDVRDNTLTIANYGSANCTGSRAYTCDGKSCRTDNGMSIEVTDASRFVLRWTDGSTTTHYRDLDKQWKSLNTTLTSCENTIRQQYAQRAYGSVRCSPYADTANQWANYYNSLQNGDNAYATQGYDSKHFPMTRLQSDLDACHSTGQAVSALFSCIAQEEERFALNETNIAQARPVVTSANPNVTYTTMGNTIVGSDGTNYTVMGNQVIGSNGTTYTTMGSTTFGSDGTTYTTMGNITYGSNGRTCVTMGSITTCN